MMRRSDSALDNRKQLGGWGEDLAADYLMSLGWVVTDRNWRCSVGEIDLDYSPLQLEDTFAVEDEKVFAGV